MRPIVVIVIIFTILLSGLIVLTPSGTAADGKLNLGAKTQVADTCCQGKRGNVDGQGIIELVDLSALISYLTGGAFVLPCYESADVDGNGTVELRDLSALVNYLTGGGFQLPNCPVQELTFAQRQVLFDVLDSAYNSLLGGPSDTVAIKLAAFLNTRPEIDSAGVIDSVSVWAWFTDGRYISIPNNRFPEGASVATAGVVTLSADTTKPEGFTLPKRRYLDWNGSADLESAQAVPAALDNELPTSIQAYVFSSLGAPCFPSTVPMVKNLLESGGYVVNSPAATVPNLLNVKGAGVFYIDAHGGGGVSRDSSLFLSIWTSSLFTAPNESLFVSMLANHELVYMRASDLNPTNGSCQAHWRYAFTGKFVAQYMTFAPNSFVLINACEGDSLPSLRLGFQAAGASVFCAWTKTVSVNPSNPASEFMFDRMLGANASNLVPRESPPQRPFDVDLLWQDLKSRGLDTDPTSGSKFRVEHLRDNFGALAPSIEYMSIGEAGDTLTLVGIFGTDPGKAGRVLVGGTDLPIKVWEPQRIVASVPNTGAGSCGPVWVEVDGVTGPSSSVKRKSNVVNLTEWRGDFTYTEKNDGTLLATLPMSIHFRADIHKFRETPHATPVANTVLFDGAQDSHAQVTANGEYSEIPSPDTWIKYQWSGTAIIPGPWENTQNGLNIYGAINTSSRATELHLSGSSNPGCQLQFTSSTGYNYSADLIFEPRRQVFDDITYAKLFFSLDNTWSIAASHRDATNCCTYLGNDLTLRLEWPLIQASFPPDTTAAQ